jgi:hypothetical protein
MVARRLLGFEQVLQQQVRSRIGQSAAANDAATSSGCGS